MEFGIFRRTRGKVGELLVHFGEMWVRDKLLLGILEALPSLGKGGVFRREKPRTQWTKAEIEKAFLSSWGATIREVKKETLRIQ